MTDEDIRKIIAHGKEKGVHVTVRDIAFRLLEREFSNPLTVFRCMFNPEASEEDFKLYLSSQNAMFTETEPGIVKREGKSRSIKENDISFEENKAELIKLLNEIHKMRESGELEAKDAVRLETDIRTKLNDKFGTTEKTDRQKVVVNIKYNHICEWTRKECFLQTKEYAMKNWGLVDIDDIRKKYDLIEKNKK